jgi:hypothetical protein
MNTHDGTYTILAGSVFGRAEEYMSGDEAWTTAVENLSQTRAFSGDPQQWSVFIRAGIRERSGNTKALVPHTRNGATIYGFEKAKTYNLALTYRFPRQRIEQGARARVSVVLTDNLKALGETSVSIDSHANSVLVPFTTKRYIEDSLGSLALAPVEEPGQPRLVISESAIQYRIGESSGFWLQTGIALLLFSLAGAFIGIDFSQLCPFSFHALFNIGWPKLTAGIVQTASLFWVFRLFGKKVV